MGLVGFGGVPGGGGYLGYTGTSIPYLLFLGRGWRGWWAFGACVEIISLNDPAQIFCSLRTWMIPPTTQLSISQGKNNSGRSKIYPPPPPPKKTNYSQFSLIVSWTVLYVHGSMWLKNILSLRRMGHPLQWNYTYIPLHHKGHTAVLLVLIPKFCQYDMLLDDSPLNYIHCNSASCSGSFRFVFRLVFRF